MSTTSKSLLTAAFSLLILAFWFVALRPTVLGGPATYLIISGISMEPTFWDGDLVVVRQRSQYHVGDIIAYSVDDYYLSQKYVIHRVVGETPHSAFLTQGDNRSNIDPWMPTYDRIIGRSFLHVPRLGVLIAFLQEDPWRVAAAAGVFMLFAMVPLGPHRSLPRQRRRARIEKRRLEKRRRERAW